MGLLFLYTMRLLLLTTVGLLLFTGRLLLLTGRLFDTLNSCLLIVPLTLSIILTFTFIWIDDVFTLYICFDLRRWIYPIHRLLLLPSIGDWFLVLQICCAVLYSLDWRYLAFSLLGFGFFHWTLVVFSVVFLFIATGGLMILFTLIGIVVLRDGAAFWSVCFLVRIVGFSGYLILFMVLLLSFLLVHVVFFLNFVFVLLLSLLIIFVLPPFL